MERYTSMQAINRLEKSDKGEWVRHKDIEDAICIVDDLANFGSRDEIPVLELGALIEQARKFMEGI